MMSNYLKYARADVPHTVEYTYNGVITEGKMYQIYTSFDEDAEPETPWLYIIGDDGSQIRLPSEFEVVTAMDLRGYFSYHDNKRKPISPKQLEDMTYDPETEESRMKKLNDENFAAMGLDPESAYVEPDYDEEDATESVHEVNDE